jgi:GntR family transcriptional repressor for pyruvate dehydrogenase complex
VGTIVKRITSTQISEPLSILINQVGKINIDHLDQVRRILEVEIAGCAASEATSQDIEELKGLISMASAIKDNSEEFAVHDSKFHHALALSTHNPLLAILLDSIQDLMEDVRHVVQGYPHLTEEVIPDHEMIFRSIEARDPDAAREAMKNHLKRAFRIQKEILAKKRDIET